MKLRTLLYIPYLITLTFGQLLTANTNIIPPSSITPTASVTIPNNHYVQGHFFNDDELFYVADEKNIESDNNSMSISVVLYNLNGDIVQPLLQKYTDNIDYTATIHTIKLQDINKDGLKDLIINLSENFVGLTYINSYFIINTGDGFRLLDTSFKEDNYEFISDSEIRVSEPLYSFGTPYENDTNEDSQSHINPKWVNHYEFTETSIELANTKFANYYKDLLKQTSKSLDKTLKKIAKYKMDQDNPELNQLQLNEYFHNISTQKLIIQRCESVIYLF